MVKKLIRGVSSLLEMLNLWRCRPPFMFFPCEQVKRRVIRTQKTFIVIPPSMFFSLSAVCRRRAAPTDVDDDVVGHLRGLTARTRPAAVERGGQQNKRMEFRRLTVNQGCFGQLSPMIFRLIYDKMSNSIRLVRVLLVKRLQPKIIPSEASLRDAIISSTHQPCKTSWVRAGFSKVPPTGFWGGAKLYQNGGRRPPWCILDEKGGQGENCLLPGAKFCARPTEEWVVGFCAPKGSKINQTGPGGEFGQTGGAAKSRDIMGNRIRSGPWAWLNLGGPGPT